MKIAIPYSHARSSDMVNQSSLVTSNSLAHLLIIQGSILLLIISVLLTGWAVELGIHWIMSGIVVGITLFVTATVVTIYWPIFNIRTFRIPGMFVSAYTLMIILPTPFVYNSHPTSARNIFLFATMLSFICTLGGIIIVHLVFPKRAFFIYYWLVKPMQTSRSVTRLYFFLLLICFGVLILYIRTVGTLPIQQIIQGGSTRLELAQARENALKLVEGRIVYVFELLRNMLFPYIAMLSIAIASTTTKRIWLFIVVISVLGNLLIASATLEKSPVMASAIMLGFTWLLLNRKPLSLKGILLIGPVALAFPIFVVSAASQFNLTTGEVIQAILERIFFVPTDVLYFHFDYFPLKEDFLLGRTLPFISKLIPGGPFPITNKVCLYMIPDATITSCSANSAYPGALWADFGWVGIVFGSFLVGVVIQSLQLLTQALPKSAPTLVLQAFIAFQVIHLTSAALPDVIFSNGIGYATILTLILLLNQSLRKKQPKKDTILIWD